MPIIDNLLEMGLRVLAVEYYGHGKTGIPDHPVSVYHAADDVLALMDSLGIDKAMIGGFSRGGAITAAFYDEYPERVLGLAMVDGGSFSFIESYDSKTDEEIRVLFATFDLNSPTYASEFDLFYEVASRRQERTPDSFYALLAQMSQSDDGRWGRNRGLATWFNDDSPEGLLYARRPSLRAPFDHSAWVLMPTVIFRNLDLPVLVIDPVQENDQFPVTNQNKALQRLHPDLVDHQVWPNTSHLAIVERPEWFLRDLSRLVERVKERWPR